MCSAFLNTDICDFPMYAFCCSGDRKTLYRAMQQSLGMPTPPPAKPQPETGGDSRVRPAASAREEHVRVHMRDLESALYHALTVEVPLVAPAQFSREHYDALRQFIDVLVLVRSRYHTRGFCLIEICFICFSIISLLSTFRVASRCGGICGSCRSLLPAKKRTTSRLRETGGWRRWSNSTAMMTRAPFCQCHIHIRATRLRVVLQKNRCGPDVAALCDIWGATRAACGKCSTCSLYTNGSTRPESKSAANGLLSLSALNLPPEVRLELPTRQKRHNAYCERWRPSLRSSSAAATALRTFRKSVTTWRGTSWHVWVQCYGSGALITAWTNVSPGASQRIRAFRKFNFHQRVSA